MTKIEKYLLEKGCKPNYRGFPYMVYAVNRILENPLKRLSMGELKKEIAEKFDTTECSVDRGLRYLILNSCDDYKTPTVFIYRAVLELEV